MKLPTDPRLLHYARTMRHDSVPAEKLLWFKLRNRQVENLKFRRQVPIGEYIADFLCNELKLIIELDGETHAGREAYDTKRTTYLADLGYNVLRFPNAEIRGNLNGVLETIGHYANLISPHPNPLPEGEGIPAADMVKMNISGKAASPLPPGEGQGEGLHKRRHA